SFPPEHHLKRWCLLSAYGSPRGADASAALYSIIETAKANDIEPYTYLRLLFTEVPKATSDTERRALLPQYLDRSRLNIT
ncbi:MAG TPA: transposase domain-containing protein, partial [Candidatus Ozemobacteraceae bacterium]|nr:transposase domain-containing protein [Candidatus Ozemobacteraceae bacterium]